MERFGFIFLVAGIGFFVLAFGVSAYLPMLPVEELEMKTVEELAAQPPVDYTLLKEDYPQALRKAFYTSTDEQVLTDLQASHADVFESVFVLDTDSKRIAALQASFPAAYKAVFNDRPVADVIDDMDFGDIDRDAVVAQLKADYPQAHTAAFESGIPSALAQLHANYAVKLLQVKAKSSAAYDLFFAERSDSEVFADALRAGQRVYIGEGCWHCHSQQIRPWGRDEARYGQISYPEEYHNELNRPPIWGTRRIGPDLVRRGGKQSNDWHVAHFYNARLTTPVSVMPKYPWFYEEDGHTLNRKGLSVLLYVQWLGSWQTSRDENIHSVGEIDRAFEMPASIVPGAAAAPTDAPADTDVTPDDSTGIDDMPADDTGGDFGDDGFGGGSEDDGGGFGDDAFGGDDFGGDSDSSAGSMEEDTDDSFGGDPFGE